MRVGYLLVLAVISSLAIQACVQTNEASAVGENPDFQKLRSDMVSNQIQSRGISDSHLLEAMRKIERHLFVPDSLRELAYIDYSLPIGEDQTISQPYIVALMTELLELTGYEKVLEIGTGSGYQAAVLAELADSVFTIEIIPDLADRSRTILEQLGYKNVQVRCADGYAGWYEHAPFDAIIVTCAPPKIPQPLIDQLAEGGRMVVPVGTLWQELTLIRKKDGEISQERIISVIFVPMVGDSTGIRR